MVQVNEKTIYILGGDQNGHKSQKTWVIHGDPITRKFKTKPGPLLKIERRQLSCAKMKIDGKVIIIVAWPGIEHGYKRLIYDNMIIVL